MTKSLIPHRAKFPDGRQPLIPINPRARAAVPPPQDEGPHVDLGLILPNPEELKAAVRKRSEHVRASAGYFSDGREKYLFLAKHDVLAFADYCDAVKRREKLLRELEGLVSLPDEAVARLVFAKRLYDRELHTPDFAGWLNYLGLSPDLANVLNELEGAQTFPESVRKMHTLISARAGWGKSELIKALVAHDVADDSAAVIVLDPHGDMVRQMARIPEFLDSGRVVLVEPELLPGFTVGINPLDASGLDERGKGHLAATLATTIGELAADLSSNMRVVARACVRVLLDVPDATLYDLATMLNPVPRVNIAGNRPPDPRQTHLLNLGRKHPDRAVSEFFTYELQGEGLESSITAVRHRVRELLSMPELAAMIGGPASLDLERAIEARKVILVNLDPLGAEGGAVMGRLLVSMVAAIGRRRGDIDASGRVPVHLFVDEATTMVSPAMVKILTQLRKFGIHLTLAQQLGASGFAGDARQEVMQNTAIKFAGGTDAGEIGRILQMDARALPPLHRGEFWVKWGAGDPARLFVRRDLAERHNDLPEGAWRDYVAEVTEAYYRSARTASLKTKGTPEPGRPPERDAWENFDL